MEDLGAGDSRRYHCRYRHVIWKRQNLDETDFLSNTKSIDEIGHIN